MTTTNSSTLQLNLKPSKQCLFLLLFIYSAPFVLIGTLPWPVWGVVIAECCLAYSLSRNIRRYASLRDPASIRKVVYTKEQGWTLITLQHTQHPAKLLPNSTVFTWLLVLNFRCTHTKKKKSVLIFTDSLPPTLFRQLRIRLKHLPNK